MKRHIVIVTPYFAPAWAYGGPPVVLSLLAKELTKKGINVSIITTDALNENRNKKGNEVINGIHVYRFSTISNTLAFRQKIFYVPNLLMKVMLIIGHADCVLFSDLRTLLNWQLSHYVLKKSIPYGIFSFGQIPYDSGWKSGVKKIFDALWVKDFVHQASWRFAQTAHEQKMYEIQYGIPKEKTHLLYLPVEKKLKSASKKDLNLIRKQFKMEKIDKVILFVGRLHCLKGIDILIESVIPLLNEDRAIKLLIVGRDDGDEARLRSLIPTDYGSKIIFTGPLYGHEMESIYKIASCFAITPRFYEETPTAALEALSHGVPVVATYEAEIPHLEEYKAGFMVENKKEKITQAIARILMRQEKNQYSEREQATELIKNIYLPSKIAKQLISYLEHV